MAAPKITLKGNMLVIEVDVSKAAIEAAPFSKSGKNKLVGTTNGFTGYGNADTQVKVSLNVTAAG